ncbi:MAG: hypothetical protein ACRYGA_18070 [Janthinobacterium lividum]
MLGDDAEIARLSVPTQPAKKQPSPAAASVWSLLGDVTVNRHARREHRHVAQLEAPVPAKIKDEDEGTQIEMITSMTDRCWHSAKQHAESQVAPVTKVSGIRAHLPIEAVVDVSTTIDWKMMVAPIANAVPAVLEVTPGNRSVRLSPIVSTLPIEGAWIRLIVGLDAPAGY